MKQYETFELRFQGEALTENYANIPLDATFTCDGKTTAVKGFYDGDGQYVARFFPEQAGEYHWAVSGCIAAEGNESCEEAAEDAHGLVKAVDTHFEFEDGKLYIPFGTTVYALAHQDDDLTEQTLATLKTAPFNKLRMCVFPKDYDYNHNEPPCYAFEKKANGSWDVSRPCIAFWQRFETILDRITAMGIQVDLILFDPYDRWGFDTLSQRENLVYLDYLLRRLAAKPGIWWSLANEYDLSRGKSLADWEEIEEFVAAHDPYGHLLSCHNCICFWDASRPNITHASLQVKGLSAVPRWLERYGKPVMIDECCYEGDLPHFWGSISAREMVNRFWRSCAGGGYCTHGETFLDDREVLWWAKGGVLKGKSPRRIAFLREIMESLPGPLQPAEGGMIQLMQMSDSEVQEVLKPLPEAERSIASEIVKSARRMDACDREILLSGEHEYASHCDEEAYLWFNDLQCLGIQTLQLPKDKQYRVECIDTWEMTRLLVADKASGTTTIRLPVKEGLAVLATRIQ